MTKQTEFNRGSEAMRTRVLELIHNWAVNSNAAQKPDALIVLQDLDGDVQIAKVSDAD